MNYIAFHHTASKSRTNIRLIGPFKEEIGGLAWSPRGDAVAYVRGDTVEMLRIGSANQ